MIEAVEFREYTSIDDANFRGESMAFKINRWIEANPTAAIVAMNTVALDGDLVSIVIFDKNEEEKANE